VLLGAHDAAGDLVYCGAVTSGLGRMAKRQLEAPLRELEIDSPPVTDLRGQATSGHGVRWVRPQPVGVVEYREFTGQRFRHPAWKGLISVDPQGITLPPLI
jgi:bifunctional non-homologous end joining protein LigD